MVCRPDQMITAEVALLRVYISYCSCFLHKSFCFDFVSTVFVFPSVSLFTTTVLWRLFQHRLLKCCHSYCHCVQLLQSAYLLCFLSLCPVWVIVHVCMANLCLTRNEKGLGDTVEASLFFSLQWRQWHFKGGRNCRELTPTAITYLETPAQQGN